MDWDKCDFIGESTIAESAISNNDLQRSYSSLIMTNILLSLFLGH